VLRGLGSRTPAWNVDELRRRARARLPRPVFDYIDGGAGDETTLAANRAAFAEIGFRPRVARDVAHRDLRRTVLGQQLDLPVLLAPTGLAGMAHPGGEVAAARAAERAGTRAVVSTGSSYRLEDVAAATREDHWFQLYAWQGVDFVQALLHRVKLAGFAVLCLTLDVPVTGNRERDVRNGFTLPPRATPGNIAAVVRHPLWAVRAVRDPRFAMLNLVDAEQETSAAMRRRPLTLIERNFGLIDPGFNWDDVCRVRDLWGGPFAVKGVLTAEDARIAADLGCDAIVVSNHGGRQLDGAVASLRALPEVVAEVGASTTVLVDGGIRRGADVAKAIALGADACLVGRPYLYGLAVGGERGVARVLEILRAELDLTLSLLGRASLAELDRSALTVAAQVPTATAGTARERKYG
jgi:isopentenyl diphosphate isomerase/L-lactate dehydrogenase-like FMN-dependent dehydrogenase